MSMVQKYMGVDGITPVLDKMGGVSWARVRQRVKKSVEKIAGALLKIYAERKVSKGMHSATRTAIFGILKPGLLLKRPPIRPGLLKRCSRTCVSRRRWIG